MRDLTAVFHAAAQTCAASVRLLSSVGLAGHQLRLTRLAEATLLHLRNFPSLPCRCVANGSTEIPHVRGTLHCRSIERNSFL